LWGETSTEIMGAEDFHIQGIDIDVLGVKTEAFPDARAYYAQGKLYLENLEGCHCTIYNINGQVIDNFCVVHSHEIRALHATPLQSVYFLKIQKQNTIKTLKFVIY